MRCPQGHDSAATDYCDVCGSPMQGGEPAAPASPPGVAAPPLPADAGSDPPAGGSSGGVAQVCPNCGATSSPDALFCEACGYDFTTGVMPRPVALTDGSYVGGVAPEGPQDSGDSGGPTSAGAGGPAREKPPSGSETAGDQMSAQSNRAPSNQAQSQPAESQAHATSAPGPGASPPGPSAPGASVSPTPAPAPAPAAPASPPGGTASKRMANRPPSRTTIKDWVAEIWIDPDWYAVQASPEPCPSPGVPDVVALHDGALVGRPSASRNIHPDIDCGADTGVSRRQGLLTTDGRRWWIEDLDSANGTYVGPASGPLPADPITAKVEVDADDRIYVGAWTRLVVRPATDSERAGLG